MEDNADQPNGQQHASGPASGLEPDHRRLNGRANANGHAFPDGTDLTRAMLSLYRDAAVGLNGLFVLTVIDPRTGKVLPQRFAISDVDGMLAEAVARAENANVYF